MYEGCPRSSWTPAQHSFIFQKIWRLLTQNIFKAFFFGSNKRHLYHFDTLSSVAKTFFHSDQGTAYRLTKFIYFLFFVRCKTSIMMQFFFNLFHHNENNCAMSCGVSMTLWHHTLWFFFFVWKCFLRYDKNIKRGITAGNQSRLQTATWNAFLCIFVIMAGSNSYTDV